MRVYAPKATVQELAANGIGEITAEYATVHEEINGEYSLSVKVAQSSAHLDAVVLGGIVKTDTPRGPQFFRMSKPVTTLDGGKEVFAWHISYDLAQDIILNRGWIGKTGPEALPEILQAGISERRFTGTSDIGLVTNMRIVRTSVLGAVIGEQDNSFINRWGGEIERDNFTINVKARLGADKGMTVRYRKNLTGLTLEEDDTEIANRIIPTGLTKNDTVVMLLNVYIDSPRINDTPIPHVRHVHFSDVKIGATDEDGNVLYSNATAVRAELQARVEQMYEQGVDLPLKSATVEFVDLSKTEEYKDYRQLETVEIGDTVTCIYRDINLSQRVVSYDYDALAKKYVSITLGSVTPTLGDSLWAHDLDLSALKNDVSGTVKQGTTYNEVAITHEYGVVTKATIGGLAIEVRQNAQEGLAVYANNAYVGGVAVKNGQVAMVSNMLTNDISGDCWAEIGDGLVDGYYSQGIALYHSGYSATNPVFKIFVSSDGTIQFVRKNESMYRLYLSEGTTQIYSSSNSSRTRLLLVDGGQMTLTGDKGTIDVDSNGAATMSGNTSACLSFGSGLSRQELGVDSAGPYRVKNNVKTYF